MPNKIQIKRGLKSKLPILLDGELGLCIDTKEVFVGNGGENIDVTKISQLADMMTRVEALSTFDIGLVQSDINCDYVEPLNGIRQGRIVTLSCIRVKFKTLSERYSYTALGRILEEEAKPKTNKKYVFPETTTGATFVLLVMTDGLVQVGCWDRKMTATDEIGFTITYNTTK